MKIFIYLIVFFSISLNAQYLVFEDKNGLMSLNDIKQNSHKLFKVRDKSSFGVTQSTIWLKIELVNNKSKSVHKYIRFTEAFLYSIEVYDERKILKGGTKVLFENRQLKYVNDTFEVKLQEKSKKDIYVKILPKYNATYAYEIFNSQTELISHQNLRDSIFLAYVSVMTVILIGSIALVVIFKERLFIYYLFFIISCIIFQFFQSGRVLKITYIPELIKYDEIIALLTVLTMTLFITTLFKKEKNEKLFFKRLFKFVYFMILFGIVLLCIDFNFYIDSFIEVFIINLGLISLFYFLIYLVIKKVKYSFFVFLGMFVFINTALLCALYYMGLFNNPFSLVIMQVGSVIEAVAFFSLILHRIYSQVILEKEKSDKYVQELNIKQTLLTHQQRLAQQGEMLSMIAHQWRQPLTAINATASNLLVKNMLNNIDSKELEKELTLITDYSQHLSSTVNDFRNFFKPVKDKENISLEKLVEKSLKIIKTSIEFDGIELVKNYSSNRTISTYSNEIQQVILNIIKNAQDALIHRNIKDKKIFIETKNVQNRVILTIADNAGGIDKKIIQKIFDPYFSTKNKQEGTGLGLYMSKTIIVEHCKGKLSVDNNKYGAIFTIEL